MDALGAFVPIDHVIVGIDSLAHGVRLLERATGLTPVYGGAHPGRGTQNALLALDNGRYLELLAPNPADSLGARSALLELHALTPIGWAIHVLNADSARAVLVARGLSPGRVRPGSRLRPDGRMLRWRTFDPFGVASEVLPFVIEWDPASPHPSSDAPRGCQLVNLKVTTARADSIGALLRRAAVDVPVAPGPKDALQLTLDCPRGRVALP